MEKSPDAFRTISEVADHLDTPAHVLRFWESRFPQIRPVKRAGGRRYYRPADVALLSGIRKLLHDEGMTIRGVQKILREQGVRHVAGLVDSLAGEDPALDDDIGLAVAPAPPPAAEIISLADHAPAATGPDATIPAATGPDAPDHLWFPPDPAEAEDPMASDLNLHPDPDDSPAAVPPPDSVTPPAADLPEADAPAPAYGLAEPEDGAWLPSRLRALPRGALTQQPETRVARLVALQARLRDLRDRMAAAGRSGRG